MYDSLDALQYASFQVSPTYKIFGGAFSILMLVAFWKLFKKAGEHGWAILIPFYNLYVLFKVAFGNGWKFLLLLIPIVNFVFAIMLNFKLAKSFGKSTGYGFGLLFLGFIFIPILAFSQAQYIGAQN